MRESVARDLVLPLYEWARGRNTVNYMRGLSKITQGSTEYIAQAQIRKLIKLLRFCREEIPYYKARFNKFEFSETSVYSEFSTIAPLEREDISNGLDTMVAPNRRSGLIRYSTGGSTGAPLIFYTDKEKESAHNAYKLHCRSWFGVTPGSRQVDFWGSPIELGKLSRFRVWKDRWLLNHVVLSAFDLTSNRLGNYVEYLETYRPRIIYGYPTVLFRIAEYIRSTGQEKCRCLPQVIVCTSEMLYGFQRELINTVFRCPVVNEYGSRDGGLIAHECEAGNLHIAAGHVYVEVDKPDDKGIGDLLVTNLDGYGMPLIRYRIGDRGRLSSEPCACGRATQVMAELAGRSNDFVYSLDGRVIHSLGPIYVLRELPSIVQFKIIQQENLHLDIYIVTRSVFNEEQRVNVKQQMATLFGFQIPIEFHIVDVIAPEASGKYRSVVSLVKAPAACG